MTHSCRLHVAPVMPIAGAVCTSQGDQDCPTQVAAWQLRASVLAAVVPWNVLRQLPWMDQPASKLIPRIMYQSSCWCTRVATSEHSSSRNCTPTLSKFSSSTRRFSFFPSSYIALHKTDQPSKLRNVRQMTRKRRIDSLQGETHCQR